MPKPLPWFRLYTESRNDSKLDALNDREFRIWHKLLCFAAESKDRGTVDYIDPEFVAMELRLGVDELDSAISRMARLRLVERSDQYVRFPSFEQRQYDKPSDRPEATRERKANSRKSSSHAMSRVDKRRTDKEQKGSGERDEEHIGQVIASIRQELEARKSA